MALRTKNNVAVLIPGASFRYLAFSLWAAQVLTLPFAFVAAMGVLATFNILDAKSYNDVGSPLLALVVLLWVLGLMTVVYGVFFLVDVVAAEKGKLARTVLTSRFAMWAGLWAIANLACVVLSKVAIPDAWPFVLGGVWVVSTAAFWRAMSSLRRAAELSRLVPLFGNLTESEMRFVSKPETKFGPGADFPRAPRTVTTVRAARAYAALAAKRQFVREQLGMMMRVIGGAFIGAAGLWTFSGEPGPRLIVFFAVLLVVFAGFQIERRHKFYASLGSEYSARAEFIAAARRRRGPKTRSTLVLRSRRGVRSKTS